MKKIFYLIVFSTLFLVACTKAEYPIPKDEFIEYPNYEGGYAEFPEYSNEQ